MLTNIDPAESKEHPPAPPTTLTLSPAVPQATHLGDLSQQLAVLSWRRRAEETGRYTHSIISIISVALKQVSHTHTVYSNLNTDTTVLKIIRKTCTYKKKNLKG